MKRQNWHLLLTLLLACFSLASSSTFQGGTDRKVAINDEESQSKQFGDGNAEEAYNQNEPTSGTSDAVLEALEILKPLEGTGAGYATRANPRTLIDSFLYYGKVLFRFLFMTGPSTSRSTTAKIDPQLTKALPILYSAAAEQDPDALFLLAEMHLYGNYTHPRDYSAAFDYYDTLASLTGNATAQNVVGFMYATGLGGVERDQARALLYHTFAADQGDTKSEMTVAFRYHSGIGTPRNCDLAAHYYKRVADKVMAYWKDGPPGGRSMVKDSYRWADDNGGLYGEGASVSSAGINADRDHTTMDDIMEYLDMRSREGDLKATFSLGRLHYEGSRTMERNFRKAQRNFMKVARSYWTKEGNINPNAPDGIEKVAGKAAAHIGRMFLRGEGTEQNFQKAHMWFKRGIQNGDAMSQYHIGLMYMDGHGVPQDGVKAASFLKAAADQDWAAAQSAIATLFLDQGELDIAVRYFELAARHGYMEAFYYLAELAEKGIGRDRHCGVATAYYKIVAEKAESLHSSFAEANVAHDSGDTETALILSMMAAEQGHENAQVNVGYLLDSQKSAFDLRTLLHPFSTRRSSPSSLTRIKPLALIYFTRSAKQSNIDSLLKAGDYYLAGIGVPESKADLEAASTCYHTAAEGHHSAQAYWNLGWMHENGVAVSQDFHMAKRFYDLALETNSEAYLPVKLALGKLRVRSWWNHVTGGAINSIHPDPEGEEVKPQRTFTEWVKNFWENAEEQLAREHATMLAEGDLDMDLGGPEGTHEPMPGGDDHFYEEFDDGIFESLIILGLAATLAILVFWRQQRQLQGQRRLREQQRRLQEQLHTAGQRQDQAAAGQGGHDGDAGAQEERGLFPDAGQPEFRQWVAGGIGH